MGESSSLCIHISVDFFYQEKYGRLLGLLPLTKKRECSLLVGEHSSGRIFVLIVVCFVIN